MASSNHVPSSKDRPATVERSVAEDTLYTPERVAAWVRGELTLAELSAVSGPEMLEMAVVGYSMYEQGRYEDARVIFSGLCALDPKEGYYRTALGAVFLALDDLPRAEKCFNVAIRLNDREIASYVNRGEVYLRQGKILEAAKDFKRAVELDPHSRDPITQRARVLAAAALQTLESAQAAPRVPQSSGVRAAVQSSQSQPVPSSARQPRAPSRAGNPAAVSSFERDSKRPFDSHPERPLDRAPKKK